MRNWLAVLAAAVSAPACYQGSNAAFNCTTDDQCKDGAGGRCDLSTTLCYYPSATCPDGAYGPLSGDKSGQCVGSTGNDIDASTGSGSGGKMDAPPDAQTFCYGSAASLVKVCLDAAPTAELKVETIAKTIDTDSDPLCLAPAKILSGGTGYCVIAATDITINATLRGVGSKPLVLVASGSITSDAPVSIDVSSSRSPVEKLGAGHDSATCNPAGAAKNKGGGAGGSFIVKGGNGGNGGNGGTAGNVVDPATIKALRGGCIGEDGDGTAGSGGHSGGALFLIANTKIMLPGVSVLAGGEGGAGATAGKGGGGGGGTGGLIGFDAPTVSVASVYANGGAGGGGVSNGGTAGAPGDDSAGAGPAQGGAGGGNSGGDGGNGSSVGTNGAGDNGGNGTNSGGGGGGGAGLIKAPATATFTAAYPAPTP